MAEKIYLVSVVIKEVEVNDKGIGRVTNNRLEYFRHTGKIGEVFDMLSDVAEDFDEKTLGV